MKRVLIVEDEILLAEELAERLIAIDNQITIIGVLSSIEEAVAWFQQNSCDLLFLDIHLNDGLSFSIFDRVDIPSPVIFTTAYDEYAIKAFDVNSIAYLLKPIDDADLQKALQKYSTLQGGQQERMKQLIQYIRGEESEYLERITLTLGKIQKPITIGEIAYFMAEDRFVFAVTKSNKRYFYESTLYDLEPQLNPKYFLRVNRTFIVNYASIDELIMHTKGRIILKLHPEPEQKVIVSNRKAKILKEWLSQ